MKRKSRVFRISVIAVFSALAFVLFLFEFPIIPGVEHLKFDLGDIPAFIGGLSFGPVAGILIELIKNLLQLFTKGIGSTMGYGNIMNFLVGIAMVVPFVLIYRKYIKSWGYLKTVLISGLAGLVSIVVVGFLGNLLIAPFYFKQFLGIELTNEALMAAVWSATALNVIKGILCPIIIAVILKPISRVAGIAVNKFYGAAPAAKEENAPAENDREKTAGAAQEKAAKSRQEEAAKPGQEKTAGLGQEKTVEQDLKKKEPAPAGQHVFPSDNAPQVGIGKAGEKEPAAKK